MAAATSLAGHGVPVKLYEASNAAGGRARSAHEAKLGTVDAGLHNIRKSDTHIWRLLERISAADAWERIPYPYGFTDYESGKRWSIRPHRPLPRAAAADIGQLLHGLIARPDALLKELLPADSPLHDEWLTPMARLLLAEDPKAAPARALRRQLLRSLKGAALYMPKQSFAEGLTAPALHHLEYFGGSVYFGHALRSIGRDEKRVHTLGFGKRGLPLMDDEAVILALPQPAVRGLFPEMGEVLAQHSAITVHYAANHREPHGMRFITSGPFDMVRYGPKRISVTIRIADAQWSSDQKALATRLWRSIKKLHPYLKTIPAYAMMREKQAGHALSTARSNLVLPKNCFVAGDWLDPSGPPRMEAAAKSGHEAADAALAWLKQFPRQKNQRRFYLN